MNKVMQLSDKVPQFPEYVRVKRKGHRGALGVSFKDGDLIARTRSEKITNTGRVTATFIPVHLTVSDLNRHYELLDPIKIDGKKYLW